MMIEASVSATLRTIVVETRGAGRGMRREAAKPRAIDANPSANIGIAGRK